MVVSNSGRGDTDALQELARQTGIQIVFFSEITAGRSSPALSGEYTLTAALTRLLEGSGLTFRQLDEHTVEVREAPPRSVRPPPPAQQSAPLATDEPMQGRIELTSSRPKNGST